MGYRHFQGMASSRINDHSSDQVQPHMAFARPRRPLSFHYVYYVLLFLARQATEADSLTGCGCNSLMFSAQLI